MAMTFLIVGPHDNPVFELEVMGAKGGEAKREDHRHFNQFIMNAAMDHVEDIMWTTQSMYLKLVDRFNDLYISAFVTANNHKMLLLHEGRSEEGIRAFFGEVYETYIKIVMNPFFDPAGEITNPVFINKVKGAARKFL